VSKQFEKFRKATPVEVIAEVAQTVAVTRRVKVKDVFDGVLSYEYSGETIDFSELEIEVFDDPSAPARVADYVFAPRHLHQALVALDDALPDNTWLAGERGTGKTEFVTQLASRLGRRLFRVNFDEAIERADFIGANSIENGSVVWKAGVITQAIQYTGAIVLVDEVGFARPQSIAILHSLCERSPHRSIVISETGQRIPVASHVAFFCADNSNGHGDTSGNFAGVRDQNTAFIDRFGYTLRFEYLPENQEVALVSSRTGLNIDASTVLIRFANVAREKARAGVLTQPPSLRQLFAWARAVSKGVPVGIAFENAIINKFPADCEAELRGVFSAVIDVNNFKSFLGGK
jgi:MoxR-like ATPase